MTNLNALEQLIKSFSAILLQETCPERSIKARTYLRNIQYSLKSLEYSYDKIIFYLEHGTYFHW